MDVVLIAIGAVLVLLATVVVWVLLLRGGWPLVLLGSDAAVDSTTGALADIPATIYYAGFVVSTLGVGGVVTETGICRC